MQFFIIIFFYCSKSKSSLISVHLQPLLVSNQIKSCLFQAAMPT